jgi:spore coat protein CotH
MLFIIRFLIVYAEWAEPGENSFMRESLAWKAFQDMGVDSLDYYQTQVRFNGKYFGKFSLGEDWDEDPLEEAGYAVTPVPGPLMKSISGEFSNLRWDLDPFLAQYYYRPITEKNQVGFDQLSEFTKGIAGASGESRSEFIFDNVNLPKVINLMAAQTLVLNQDRCSKNFYVYLDPSTGQWSMLPWDLESAFSSDRGLGGTPARDYCILECEQWYGTVIIIITSISNITDYVTLIICISCAIFSSDIQLFLNNMQEFATVLR